MKQALFFLFIGITVTACGQKPLNDASLHVQTDTLQHVCQCNDAFILVMKESVDIMTRMKQYGKDSPKVKSLDDELRKRNEKHYELYQHCKPIYDADRYAESKCSNHNEGEELDRKLNELRQELGIN